MLAGHVERARAALARGDVLIAYDEAVSAVEVDPDDLDARFLAALALARAGAAERARAAADELVARIRRTGSVAVSLQVDAEALLARLAKDAALGAPVGTRQAELLHAAQLYERVAERFGGYYACINAATLRLLAGDLEWAHSLAARALALATARTLPETLVEPGEEYWRAATIAEAALILGDDDAIRTSIARAASIAGGDAALLAVTRRQLRLVSRALHGDETRLDALAPPSVLHYCGHRIDGSDDQSRFPDSLASEISREIHEFLASRHVGFGYGALASGADILVAEALLETHAQLHVVLPFAVEEFDRVSVAPAGSRWSDRFRACLTRASSVRVASDSSYSYDDQLFGHAARIAMGHALNQATHLDARAEQLAIWDNRAGVDVAGTAHDVAAWAKTGYPSHVISLPGTSRQVVRTREKPETAREVGGILFADFRGFSRLHDEHFVRFVTHVFAALGATLDGFAGEVLWRNTWGDAIAAVFRNVAAAARCALEMQDALASIDLASLGLPHDLDLRIGAHAGSVMLIDDPVSHRPTYWGRELTRAARIEPRTPEGEVYVTDTFAALLALEPDASFASEYVGRVTTAKDFETIPMYRLRRRLSPSAGESL